MTTAPETTSIQMTEAEMKTLIRNALIVAGQEMGAEGDHWPVVKNTITDIMRDWEELECERAASAEMKPHFTALLSAMADALKTCTPEEQESIAPRLAELREVFEAAFDDPKEQIIDMSSLDEDSLEELPAHCKRAKAILDTLFEEDKLMEENHG